LAIIKTPAKTPVGDASKNKKIRDRVSQAEKYVFFFTSVYEESFLKLKLRKVEKLHNFVEHSDNNPCLEINILGSLAPALSLPFATFQEKIGRALEEIREERGTDTAVTKVVLFRVASKINLAPGIQRV